MALFKKEVLDKVAEVFAFSKGAQDNLNQDGYKIAITALLGVTPSDLETDTVFKAQKHISLHQFRDLVRRKLNNIYMEQYINDIMLIFDDQCKGYITLTDLRKSWDIIEADIPWCKLEETFREVTTNNSLNYSQFVELVLKVNANIS